MHKLACASPLEPDHVNPAFHLDGVRALAERVLDLGRREATVLLTTRPAQTVPALDPDDVRSIVGLDVEIYVVPSGPLTRELERLLPPKLHAFGGAARIWWPGVGPASDPHDHPLVHDPYQVYGSKSLDDFKRAFQRGAPDQPARVDDPRISVLEHDRATARAAVERLRRALISVEAERDRALERAASSERRLRDARRAARVAARRGSDTVTPADPEASFHELVVRAWIGALSPDDQQSHPLRGYRLGEAFQRSVDALGEIDAARVAWVCAMVACRRAGELDGLAAHPLRTGPGGNDPQRVRADGARAMRCALKRFKPSAPRLHWWELPDGTVAFASVQRHDDMSIPD